MILVFVALNILVGLAPAVHGGLWPFVCVVAAMFVYFFLVKKSWLGSIFWYASIWLGIVLYDFLSYRTNAGRGITSLFAFCMISQLAYQNRLRTMGGFDAKGIQDFLTDIESVVGVGLGAGMAIIAAREPNLSPALAGLGVVSGLGQGLAVWLFKERHALLLPVVFGLALAYVAVVALTHQATTNFVIGFGVCTLILMFVEAMRRLNATLVIAEAKLARP